MFPSLTPVGSASHTAKQKTQELIQELDIKEQILRSKREAIIQVPLPVMINGTQVIIPTLSTIPKTVQKQMDIDEELLLQQQQEIQQHQQQLFEYDEQQQQQEVFEYDDPMDSSDRLQTNYYHEDNFSPISSPLEYHSPSSR
jgi:hypothetical protein